jgi:OmpA-OmpF porin, OOP family
MKRAIAFAALGLVALAGFATPFAAAPADNGGWYVGGNAGVSLATIDEERIVAGLAADGFTTTSFSDDERDFGFKLFAGRQFGRYFAIEAGYFDLGEFSFTATTMPQGTLDGKVRFKGQNFDLVGILPFTERFSAFGRVGVNVATAKAHFSGTGAVNVTDPDRRKRAANVKYGLGLEYDFTRNFGARAEFERYRVDDSVGNKGDVDLASLGLVFRFGGPQAAPVVAAPPPPPPPAAPRPPPPPPPPPPEPMLKPEPVVLEGVEFEFDSARLRPNTTAVLDEAVAALRRRPEVRVLITGHTCTMGPVDYNMDLSLRRAQSVKDYLTQRGIAAERLRVEGAGQRRPIASNDTREGRERNRRVDMKVVD